MLRGNLSTRPFYNERLAIAAIGLVALMVVLLTSFNVTQLVRLSAERREFVTRIDRDQAEAARVKQQATAQQQGVDRTVLGKLAASTREANDLIDQRTFSWTAFFRLIEKTLPLDVRLVMVSPRVEKGEFKVAMTVVARSYADVATFVDSLGGTGAFYDVAAIDQQRKDDGMYTAAIEASYLSPTLAQPAATPEPATGTPR